MSEPLWDGDPVRVGPYELVGRLGVGGMGEVFLGRSPGGRLVAVKTVRPELAADREFRRRFTAEVVAARKVGGFYTAEVLDADTEDSRPWLATAFIPGMSLQQAVAEYRVLPAGSVAMLGAGLAEGLIAVHAQELVHRDLKPANVILAPDGPRLIDFGIARALDATSYTRTHTVLGTAAFMSPEQINGEPVGPASDVFSLGCVLGFAATGQSPFGNGPVPAIAFRVVHNEPDLTDIPDELASVIGRCLTKTPAGRPTTQTLLTTLGSLGRDLETSGEHSGGDSDSGGDSGGEGRADHQSSWLPPDLTETISRRATEVLRDPGMPRTTPMGRTDRTRVDESAATDQARQQQQQQEQQQQERSSRTEGGSTGTKSRQEPDRERPPDPGGGVQEGTRGGADGTASGKGTREKASGGQGKGAGAAGTSANERRERPRENAVDEQRRKNDGAAGSATATRRPAEAFQLIPRRAHAAQRRAERRKGLVRLALAPFGFYLLVVLAGLVFSLIQGDRASIGVLFAFAWDVMTSLPLAGFLALIWILSLIDTLTEGMAHGRLEVNAEGIAAVDDRLSPSTDRTVRLAWRDLRRVRLVASGRLYHIVVEFDEDRKKALARQHRLSQKEGGYLLATLHPSSGSERTASVEQLRDAVRRFGALADQG